MKHYRKLLSLLLIICISMTMLTGYIPVNAVTPTTEPPLESIMPFELPDIVDAAEAEEKGYIGRIKTEEKDLYTFVFANGDGTNTMRVYGHPVKYVAKDGTIRDISLDVKAKADGGFVTADHEIITTFEKTLTNGVSLTYNDVEVTLVPKLGLGKSPTATLDSNNKVVTYKMNDVTSFVYELTYAGFKEDIVVKEYTGQTEYEFTLFTNGLTLCEEYGSYHLADAEGNVEATIGDIIVFTADERNNTMGSMTYETVRANQEYVLTIHLDADYLADEDTVYPIRIDPTIEINYDNNGAGAIEDITINSLQGSDGLSRSLFVGRRDTYGLSRVLMKFPNLSLNGISANQITSATVELRDLICQGDEDITVECCIYNTNAPAWVEDETTSWQSVGSSYIGSLLDSHVISYGEGNVAGEQHRYSFDILTAAKAWANGTEDPNKGLVFKANSTFENQTGDAIKTWYKTFSSYNRAEDYRPSLSITYEAAISLNNSEVSIVEEGTKTLVAITRPNGQSVTWSTNNSSVATVSTSGVVSAKKAGVATISASITEENGIRHTAQCKVYVYVANGVYYIQNYFTEYYLHVQNGKATGLPNVYQYSKYSDSTSNDYKIRQMWKTYYLGEGRYSVRPMHKLNMALDVTGNNVDVYNIGTTDTLDGVPSCAEWTIEWYSTGYVFKKDGSNNHALQVEDASKSLGANIIADTYSNSLTRNRWNIEKISSPPIGVLLYDTSTGYTVSTSTEYVAPEESRSLSTFKLDPAFYSGTSTNQDFYWYSSNTSKATVNSSTGEVTGISPGTATITGRKYYSGTYYYLTYTIIVTEIPSGTYFLKNKQTGHYADIDGQTMADGTTIHQWLFHGGDSQKWTFKHVGEGYYSIKSDNSSSAYYLGVINDSTELDVDIVLRTGAITDGMKWKIEETPNGAYNVIPKTGESKGYILATTTSNAWNGYHLIQGNHDNSYRDEWYIRPVVYAFSVGGEFHNGEDVMDAAYNWQSCGYSSNYNINPTVSTLDYEGLNSEVVYFSTHGSQHRIKLLNGVYLSDSFAPVTAGTVEIDDFTLPNAKLYIYDACLTACNEDGTGQNLCTETISSGVDCVIGWTKSIGANDAQEWQARFQSKLIVGESVKDAADYANTFSYRNNDTIKSWLIYGNQDLIINQNGVAGPDLKTGIDDGSLKQVSIKYDSHNIITLQSVLKQEYKGFLTDAATVAITYTNMEKTDYVIDYYYLHGDFVTESGYSIIVNNGNIVYIRDNTIDTRNIYRLPSQDLIPEVTAEMVVAAYTQAKEEITSMGANYSIVEQCADKFYDITTNKYYYRIMNVYETPDGTYGATFTMYEL